jgi:nicotinamide-nucleotide amidase
MFADDLKNRAQELLEAARKRGLHIVTAESCTGGLIVALLTEIPGSSDIVERGFVTYSDAAKTEMLGVSTALIERHGAVSPEVAVAMAEGALKHSHAQLAVAVTGIAGPGGGSPAKPVGLVHLALARTGGATLHRELRLGEIGREAVRMLTVDAALGLLRGAL